MIRVSSILLGTFIAAVFASGCQVSVKGKHRFSETKVDREDTAEWKGEPIKINIQGVGVSVSGGVKVTADPTATTVRATARMLAMALPEEKANADLSITDAKDTFAITRDANGGVLVSCGHGGTYGSSTAGESGCELVEIVVPAGNDDNKLELTVLSGNGTMTLQLSQAAISNLGANSGGDIDANLPATQEASISLVTERSDDITAALPSDFAADEVILQADADKIALGPYSDVNNGAGAGGRGEQGTGLRSLKLTSKTFARSTGSITLK